MSPAVPAASTLPVTKTGANVDPPNSLIRTKLYRPSTRSDLNPRARLIERLNAGLSGKVTIISALAGFGKTTLLAEWLYTTHRLPAWLALDPNDIELRGVVHALSS